MLSLFGVKLPRINKEALKRYITNDVRPKSKEVLFFLYSEFLLRANRNPYYKDTLNKSTVSAIDGKGLHWSMWRIMDIGSLPKLYKKYCLGLPTILRLLLFGLLFIGECVVSIIIGFFTLVVTKHDLSKRTDNQLVLGRDFVYDLFEIAQNKTWKTLIVGGNNKNSRQIEANIRKLYPNLEVFLWNRASDSDLMRDISKKPDQHLKTQNLFDLFPDLLEAKNFVKQLQPDLILVCLGGSSGKQEFFIDNLLLDSEVNFGLATGIGAALDHLGAGAEQTIAPKWMIDSGLEWVHRLAFQPYRRKRILDSIFTLWWWTVVEEFKINTGIRPTVVNIIKNRHQDFLVVKRKELLPGDVDYSFVQGGIENAEKVESAGIREACEEVGFDEKDLIISSSARLANLEEHSTSFVRFVLLGAKYFANQNYINYLEYMGEKEPKTNWENQKADWIDQNQLKSFLSIEKQDILKYLD